MKAQCTHGGGQNYQGMVCGNRREIKSANCIKKWVFEFNTVVNLEKNLNFCNYIAKLLPHLV